MAATYQNTEIPMATAHATVVEDKPTMITTLTKMKSASSSREVMLAFFAFCGLLSGTICLSIVTTLLSLIPLYLLIVGAINVYNCPGERYIPIFMIVTGVFSLLRVLLDYFFLWKRRRSSDPVSPEEAGKPSPFSGLISLFLFAWLIAGTVWVMRFHPEYSNTTSPSYCNKLTYMSAYIFVILSWSVLAFVLFVMSCLCCLTCGAMLFNRNKQ